MMNMQLPQRLGCNFEQNHHVNKTTTDIAIMPVRKQYELNRRLAMGLDLYGWKHQVTRNGKSHCFVVANDCIGGRGLRWANATPVGKGQCIAIAPGDLVASWRVPPGDAFKWQVSKATPTKKGRFLVLRSPTWDGLGNVINTSDGSMANNCRLQHRPGNNYLSVLTTRIVYPGDELLVPYGGKFTGAIRAWLRLQ